MNGLNHGLTAAALALLALLALLWLVNQERE